MPDTGGTSIFVESGRKPIDSEQILLGKIEFKFPFSVSLVLKTDQLYQNFKWKL